MNQSASLKLFRFFAFQDIKQRIINQYIAPLVEHKSIKSMNCNLVTGVIIYGASGIITTITLKLLINIHTLFSIIYYLCTLFNR